MRLLAHLEENGQALCDRSYPFSVGYSGPRAMVGLKRLFPQSSLVRRAEDHCLGEADDNEPRITLIVVARAGDLGNSSLL